MQQQHRLPPRILFQMRPRSIANIKDANYHSNYLQNKQQKQLQRNTTALRKRKSCRALDFQRSALKSHDD
jgi:hypothetical protein